MVKVERLCVIIVLVFTNKLGTSISINTGADLSTAQEENSTSVIGKQTTLDQPKIRPLNTTMRRVKEEIREYYRNLRKTRKLMKNISNIQNFSKTLNEQGKPIQRAVCGVINYDYDWARAYCANKLRSSPFLNAENLQCSVSRSSGVGFNLKKTPSIKIVSDFELGDQILLTNTSIKNQTEPGNCTVVIFYARWCNMSAKAAPHFNAIPRGFKNIRFVAVDTYKHPEAISTFVIYAVPTVLLFHNGRIQARFTNDSYDIASVAEFLEKYTDQEFALEYLQPSDYDGPIPSVAVLLFERNELVIFAWIFIIFSCIYGLKMLQVISPYSVQCDSCHVCL